jgi:hypothetical protein
VPDQIARKSVGFPAQRAAELRTDDTSWLEARPATRRTCSGSCSLQKSIDTTTGGQLIFNELTPRKVQCHLIRERTSAGLAAARARGRHGGRPSVLTGHKLKVAQEMYSSGQYTVAATSKPTA